jgi:hypothetical protein
MASERGHYWALETLVRLQGEPDLMKTVSGIIDDAIDDVHSGDQYRRALKEIVRCYERANKKDSHTALKMYQEALKTL